ncbi:hypothetical protein M9H77_28305 [Catharanthus roseus]|uniref:Uncharacterized protein n=1 Tax=Catharanthus roseus TaxID=4058 RepID=A0ACC0AGE1_CATRO|nr:hypothetical protein M9H77_28305 [Catharanthus roseus]
MPRLKDKLISDSPPSVPTPSSISVEVEVISEPLLESPLEPETNLVISTPFSSTLDPFSIPETPDLVLEDSDEDAEHLEPHAQALRDYQLERDRVCRRIGAHLTGSRNAGSDRVWPPGLPVGVSPI